MTRLGNYLRPKGGPGASGRASRGAAAAAAGQKSDEHKSWMSRLWLSSGPKLRRGFASMGSRPSTADSAADVSSRQPHGVKHQQSQQQGGADGIWAGGQALEPQGNFEDESQAQEGAGYAGDERGPAQHTPPSGIDENGHHEMNLSECLIVSHSGHPVSRQVDSGLHSTHPPPPSRFWYRSKVGLVGAEASGHPGTR